MIYYLDFLLYEKFGHDYLQKIFSFPDYYGKNLDAFYDLITEFPACFIALSHYQESENSQKLLQTLLDVQEEYPHIHLLHKNKNA